MLQFRTREMWLRLAKVAGCESPPWPFKSRKSWLALSELLPYLAEAIESGKLDEQYSALSVEERIALCAEALSARSAPPPQRPIDVHPYEPDLSVPNTAYWRTGHRR